MEASLTTKVTSTESACVFWGTGELLVKDLLGPVYRVWNGSCRGAGSPPEHCQGALEQITALLIGSLYGAAPRYDTSPLMHVYGSRWSMCVYFGPVYVKEITSGKNDFLCKGINKVRLLLLPLTGHGCNSKCLKFGVTSPYSCCLIEIVTNG